MSLRKKRTIIKPIPKTGVIPAEAILVETGILEQVIELVWETMRNFLALVGAAWIIWYVFVS